MTDRCSCAKHADGSVTTMLCPTHSDRDPCERMAAVTGTRRKGSIVRGTCSNCGWSASKAAELFVVVVYENVESDPLAEQVYGPFATDEEAINFGSRWVAPVWGREWDWRPLAAVPNTTVEVEAAKA